MEKINEPDELIYDRYLAKHNENDLRILLERHRESLVLFLMSFVHNMEDAEELMLDAYAKAAAGARFLRKSSFKTWLFSIGKNLALMYLRKKHPHFSVLEDQADDKASSPELELLSKERNRQLYQAIETLKEEYQQVLILLYFEEMSPEEVGQVMKKSRKQIYNLTERSKQALKKELERIGLGNEKY